MPNNDYKKIWENQKKLFIENIKNHKNNLWFPGYNQNKQLQIINKNAWFNIEESQKKNNKFSPKKIIFDKGSFSKIKAKKIILKLTARQKKIINNWLKFYAIMYNQALKLIKQQVVQNKSIKTYEINYYKIRESLYKIKHKICANSQIKTEMKNTKIKIHDLDYAIKLACTNYKSAKTNFKKGNIHHFRIRYWKHNKKIKIMDMEKNNFKSGSIRKQLLGNVVGTYNGDIYDFSKIDKDCKLGYNEFTDTYTLYVPEKVNKIKQKKFNNKIISLDPGLRTFMTGISENNILKIGNNSQNTIKKYLSKIDRIKLNINISKNRKLKIERKYNRKITNKVDDLHWKSIHYLIKNYKTILIGNMSSKKIVSKTGNLNKMSKRVCNKLKLYEFRNRLYYKCFLNGNNVKCVNESFTSKVCSNCGEIEENLGSKKIFDCKKCKKKIDRDINGARNIYLKSTYEQ